LSLRDFRIRTKIPNLAGKSLAYQLLVAFSRNPST
jgi:hypothetical protein